MGSKDTSSTTNTSTQPWAPAIPGLTDLINRITSAGKSGGVGSVTPEQSGAFTDLKNNAGTLGSFAPDISSVANDTFNFGSDSGMVGSAYSDLASRLTPWANGGNIDVTQNPQIKKMLDVVNQDTSNDVNGLWSAAGRSFSPGHAMALGRGVAAAEAPILLNQYNTEAERSLGAAKDIFGGATSAAGTMQGLDTNALTTRQGGFNIAQMLQDAKNYGPNAILNLSEQMKKLPLDELGWISQYLTPIAQLGQQGHSTTDSTTTSAGFTLNDLFKGAGATSFMLGL
jgi:hypothetical protein